jgi:hypothetical protein
VKNVKRGRGREKNGKCCRKIKGERKDQRVVKKRK